jgi:hypothetical protein
MRSSSCHFLFRPLHLQVYTLTCANVGLTGGRAAATFRFAPSSRRERREEDGRAKGKPQGGTDAPGLLKGRKVGGRTGRRGRPQGRKRRPAGRAARLSRREARHRGGGRKAESAGARRMVSRKVSQPQGRPTTTATGAEIAWGTRARGADGGRGLRFTTSRRSLGFFFPLPCFA